MRQTLKVDGLTIELRDGGYGDPEVYVKVDGHDYITVARVHIEHLDMALLTEWIVATYEPKDVQSKQYCIGRIDGSQFLASIDA